MRIFRYAAGAFIGTLVGGILAVNIVIFSGAEQGYESSLADVFEHSTIAGILAVAVLLAGPITGVVAVHRARGRRGSIGNFPAVDDQTSPGSAVDSSVDTIH